MIDRPEVRVRMAARPEGVGVVRQALVGMADALAFDADVLADMRMAVTEACTNVVVHAYDGDGEHGALEIDLFAEEAGLTVVVRDHGSGIRSANERGDTAALGLGLPLIAALSDDFEVTEPEGGGTEVRMSFLASRKADPADANPIGETGWEPPGPA